MTFIAHAVMTFVLLGRPAAQLRLHCKGVRAPKQVVDLDALRELAWSGIPADLRPVCWQLLLGYLPPNRERRHMILPWI